MRTAEGIDPFTYSVLGRIDPDVRKSLTATQLAGIRVAISGCRPLDKHPVDVRGVIPLFFARYYFVVVIGRDRRSRTQQIESERRREGSFAGGLGMMTFIVLLLLGPAIMTGLYFLKTMLGINIYPDKHA